MMTTAAQVAHGMTVIHDVREIPAFTTEEEEVSFWETHSLAPELIDEAEPLREEELPPPRPRSRPTAIRFDGDTLRRLKAIAALKGMGYQTLLKEFVIERLYEEEQRAGLVGGASTGVDHRRYGLRVGGVEGYGRLNAEIDER